MDSFEVEDDQDGEGRKHVKKRKVKVPAVKKDVNGRRYFMLGKRKKVYIPKGTTRNDLIKYILDTFVKKKKRRAKATTKQGIKTPTVSRSVTSSNGPKVSVGGVEIGLKPGIAEHLGDLLKQANIPRLAQALEQKLLAAPAPPVVIQPSGLPLPPPKEAKAAENGKEGKHSDIGGFTMLPSGRKLHYLKEDQDAADEALDILRKIGQKSVKANSSAQAAESERQFAEAQAELARKQQQATVAELEAIRLNDLRSQRARELNVIEYQAIKSLNRMKMISDYNAIFGPGTAHAGDSNVTREYLLQGILSKTPANPNKDKQAIIDRYRKLYKDASDKIKGQREEKYKVPSPPPSPTLSRRGSVTPPRKRADTGSSSSSGSAVRRLVFQYEIDPKIAAELLSSKGFERATLLHMWSELAGEKEYNGRIDDIKDNDLVAELVFKYKSPKVVAKYNQIKEQQEGFGLPAHKKGLMSDEIYSIMSKYPEFIDVIPRDGIEKYILPFVHPKHDAAFIINSEKEGKSGEHWMAIYISPVKHRSLEFYDSFGREMPQDIANDVKLLVDRMSPDQYLMLKQNRIVDQRANSDECGYFAMDFIMRRLRGQPFRDVTGYSNVEKAEKDIKVFKDKYKDFDFFNSK